MGTVAPGDDLAARVAEGGELRLQAGTHVARLMIERSVTLIGEPGAVLDAGGRGCVVHVSGDDAAVVLRGLTLANGRGELGAGLRVDGWSDVRVEDCAFEGNLAREGGGNGLGVARGSVSVERTRFADGQGLLLTQLAEIVLVDTTIEADVRLREKAQVTIRGGRIAGEVSVRGTTTRAPRLVLDGVTLAVPVLNDPELPGEIVGG